jgi:hypothetical protein
VARKLPRITGPSDVGVLIAFGAPVEAKAFCWANDGDLTTMDPHARSDLFVTSFDMNMYEALLITQAHGNNAKDRGHSAARCAS